MNIMMNEITIKFDKVSLSKQIHQVTKVTVSYQENQINVSICLEKVPSILHHLTRQKDTTKAAKKKLKSFKTPTVGNCKISDFPKIPLTCNTRL